MRQAHVSGMIRELSSDGVTLSEEGEGSGYPVLTLTVWESLQSLYRFTYSGKHSQALRNRNQWMESESREPSFICHVVDRKSRGCNLGGCFQ